MRIILRIIASAAALGVAAWVVPGITVTGGSNAAKAGTLLAVAVIVGIINAVLKPIIKKVGCAFYVLTLGLVALVINGLLLWLASWVAGKLSLPFPRQRLPRRRGGRAHRRRGQQGAEPAAA